MVRMGCHIRVKVWVVRVCRIIGEAVGVLVGGRGGLLDVMARAL